MRSAIALAGSAAQSRLQPFPGDWDLFERIHIRAASREAAAAVLVDLLLVTVAAGFPERDLQLVDLKLGVYPDEVDPADGGRPGAPISWRIGDLDARAIAARARDGAEVVIDLGTAAQRPGFVKLEWIHADPERGVVVTVSKVMDVTWEAPDGAVQALDGLVDPLYQEVYLDLDAGDRADVQDLADDVAGLPDYVRRMEDEIRKHGHQPEGFGKVAKRLYNVFRATGRRDDAAYLETLFRDGAARLYQAAAQLYAVAQGSRTRRLERHALERELERIARAVGDHYESDDGPELARRIGSLLTRPPADLAAEATAISEAIERYVGVRFRARLLAHADIAAYLASLGVAANAEGGPP